MKTKHIYELIDLCCVKCDKDREFREKNKSSCKILQSVLYGSLFCGSGSEIYRKHNTMHCKTYDRVMAEKRDGQIMITEA